MYAFDIATDISGTELYDELVKAADALTASDRHDATASNIARIRFFFTLNTSC